MDVSSMMAAHKRNVKVQVQSTRILLENLYHVPGIKLSVLSCSWRDEWEISISIAIRRCSFYYRNENSRHTGSVEIDRENGLFCLPINKPKYIRVTDSMKHEEEQNVSEYKNASNKECIDRNAATPEQSWLVSMAQANKKAIKHVM